MSTTHTTQGNEEGNAPKENSDNGEDAYEAYIALLDVKSLIIVLKEALKNSSEDRDLVYGFEALLDLILEKLKRPTLFCDEMNYKDGAS